MSETPEWMRRPLLMPELEGWRTVSPVDAFGTGISMYYSMELVALSQGHPDAVNGCTVTADYEQIDGQWFPIRDSLRISPPATDTPTQRP